jgi:hypothetical protein
MGLLTAYLVVCTYTLSLDAVETHNEALQSKTPTQKEYGGSGLDWYTVQARQEKHRICSSSMALRMNLVFSGRCRSVKTCRKHALLHLFRHYFCWKVEGTSK